MDRFLYELYTDIPRLGPGSSDSTRKAFYTLPKLPHNSTILDVGCGMGSQTMVLANLCDYEIVALDNYSGYLKELARKAKRLKLDKIHTVLGDMTSLPFSKAEFDIIWSEGAIYNIGFAEGLREWRFNLKTSGFLVVSELAWFKENPPEELESFWRNEYPGMKNHDMNVKIADDLGYNLLRHFKLPESDWWDSFYAPLEKRINQLKIKYQHDHKKMDILDITKMEIDFFQSYADYYGYIFYILQKR